jgi:hypothetical protein
MIESLSAAGVEQMAVIPRASIHHDRLAAAGIQTAGDALDPWLGLLRRRKLAALIETFRPDLVHCWMRRAASLVPKLDVPVIGWFGGYYDPANFPRCSHFVGVTPAIVEHMVERGVPKCARALRADVSDDQNPLRRSRANLATPPTPRCCSPCRGCTRRRGSMSCSRRLPSCRHASPGLPAMARSRAT